MTHLQTGETDGGVGAQKTSDADAGMESDREAEEERRRRMDLAGPPGFYD